MMHKGATTRLLAGPARLTRSIAVTISFRKGYPAASTLYALQEESLLQQVAAA